MLIAYWNRSKTGLVRMMNFFMLSWAVTNCKNFETIYNQIDGLVPVL